MSDAQVAREMGIAGNLLPRWKRESVQTGRCAFSGTGKMAKLKRETARVKKEPDILQEATAFFANESS